MKKKSLFISGALALSILAAPASTLAASEDCQTVKVAQKTIQIDSIQDWVTDNKDILKSGEFQQLDIQSLLKQFQLQTETPQPAAKELPKQAPQVEEPKQAAPVEQPAAQPAPQPAQEPAPKAEETQEQTSSDISAFEKEVVELTNQERAKQGLAPLKLDPELSAVAKDKSLDMQKNDYFSHTSPTYGSPFDMMNAYGIDYRTAGENIAMGQTSPEQVVNGWMNSPGHRKNIMNPNFTHIGVGYAAEGNYWTQMFIGK